MTGSVYARFESPVHMYRGETMAGIIADEARLDSSRGFVGGYYMETLSLGPAFLAAFADPGGWGPKFTEVMAAYENTAGMWIVGEDMPQESNRVTLNREFKDQWGLPSPDVTFADHPNDTAMREHGFSRGDAIYESVGATGTQHTPPYPATHNLGTSRMSDKPADGVLDRWGEAHDVPGLFVSDGSVMTTGGAANPDAHHRRAGHPAGGAHRGKARPRAPSEPDQLHSRSGRRRRSKGYRRRPLRCQRNARGRPPAPGSRPLIVGDHRVVDRRVPRPRRRGCRRRSSSTVTRVGTCSASTSSRSCTACTSMVRSSSACVGRRKTIRVPGDSAPNTPVGVEPADHAVLVPDQLVDTPDD